MFSWQDILCFTTKKLEEISIICVDLILFGRTYKNVNVIQRRFIFVLC